jgi:hypothetical protein
MLNVCIAEVGERVDTLVGFFEDRSELGAELGTRAASTSRTIVCAHRVCGAPQLTGGLLGLLCRRESATDLQDPQGKQSRPFLEIPWRHA